ncbi:MAG: VOC family protein [Rhodospirillaceae bacterium]|nr:VOC family protein [Rhodospirillaceae bacterium]
MWRSKFLVNLLEQFGNWRHEQSSVQDQGPGSHLLRVRDRDRMVRFYCDILGCTMEREQAEIGLTQVRAGRSLIDLVPVDGKLGRMGGAAPGKEGRNLDHFCITLDRYDEAKIRAYLTAQGVEIGEAGSRYGAEGEGPSLYVSDPEGNVVELKGPPWSA